jgi:dienelactone hydrolase
MSTGFSDVATARKFYADLKTVSSSFLPATVFMYDGVGHSFMNTAPAPFASFGERREEMGIPLYHSEAAEVAWSRVLSFFTKHLPSGPMALAMMSSPLRTVGDLMCVTTRR